MGRQLKQILTELETKTGCIEGGEAGIKLDESTKLPNGR
jgi:hypothetical protein